MNKKYLPSKKFVKIALGALVVLFIIYMSVLYAKTYKTLKNPSITTSTVPVQELLDKDTDSDGVRDWEEVLWGTDLTLSSTFGMPDKQYVEGKRKELGAKSGETGESSENLNDTEKIAREFLSTIISLKQSNTLNAFNIKNLAEKFSNDIGADATLSTKYKINDISTGSDTLSAKKDYYSKFSKAFTVAQKGGMGTELQIMADYFSNENADDSKLNQIASTYATLTKTLKSMQVPSTASTMHLDLLNEADSMATIFKNMTQIGDNSIIGLVAIAQFENNEPKMEASISNFIAYFKASAIIK